MVSAIRKYEIPSLIKDIENTALLDATQKFSIASQLCFFIENGFLYHEEYHIREHLKHLITDSNQEIRIFISEKLKHSTHLPHEIAVSLAHDISAVAVPIILYSPQLMDTDLIDLFSQTREPSKLLALSQRNHLSEKVSLWVYSTKDVTLILNVIKNPTNKISLELYRLLLHTYHYDKSLISVLLSRDLIDKEALQKLLTELDPKAKRNINKYFSFSIQNPDNKFCATHITSFKDYPSSDEEHALRATIERLYLNNNLNSAVIIFYLCKGDLYSFLYGISKLSELPFSQVKYIVNNNLYTQEFTDIYQNAGLPMNFIHSIQKIINVVINILQEGENITIQNFPSLIKKRLKEHIKNRDIEGLNYLMKLIAR